MNRPILVIAIGYIIGIIWGIYISKNIVLFYFCLLIFYLIINFPYRKKKFKILSIKRYFRYIKKILKIQIIIMIIISSMISNYVVKIKNNQYNNLFKDINELEITAIIISNKIENQYKDQYRIKISEGKFKNIDLYIYVDKNQKLEFGDKIKITGEYIEPQNKRNYKGFNYKEYLKTQEIYGTIKANKIDIISPKFKKAIFNDIFLKIKSNIENTYSEQESGIILGILFGYTENIEEEIKEQFSNSNISHILAVSGMHISYLIYLITNSTQKLVGKRKSKTIASLFLIVYMFITNFAISVVRACIMGIINCLSFVVYRKNDTLNNIAISALIILLKNPFNINNLSFLLSYGGTLGIIIFNPIISQYLKNIRIKNRKWKYIFIKIQRKSVFIIDTISISLSAQLVILPIIILNFNKIGIAFLITNLLLNFVIGIIVMGGMIQVIISFISLKFGIAIANILEHLIKILILISEIGDKIPFGNFYIITPEIYEVIFYYCIIIISKYYYQIFHQRNLSITQIRIKNILHIIKYKINPYKKKIKICFTLLIIILLIYKKIPKDLEIFFVDVSQGDSTLIITPQNNKILIDGGGSQTYDIGKNILMPYLLARKINKLDYIMISHTDDDHISGLIYVINEMKVKNIIIGKQFENSENLDNLLKLVQDKKINLIIVEKGERISIEKDLYFDVFWPSSNTPINENIVNNNSLVCKLVYKDFSMLFTGDIEEKAEKSLINIYKENLKADILKVAHHGSETSTSQMFLQLVNPQITLIGVGKNNLYNHPSDNVINRIEKMNIEIYRTDINGEISIIVDKNGKYLVKSLL